MKKRQRDNEDRLEDECDDGCVSVVGENVPGGLAVRRSSGDVKLKLVSGQGKLFLGGLLLSMKLTVKEIVTTRYCPSEYCYAI